MLKQYSSTIANTAKVIYQLRYFEKKSITTTRVTTHRMIIKRVIPNYRSSLKVKEATKLAQ